jgi:5-enolpyruvylshikimate-3-phosphate synthase
METRNIEVQNEENMATNATPKREYQPPKTLEVKVDASTLTILAVAALLLPLLIVGFLG